MMTVYEASSSDPNLVHESKTAAAAASSSSLLAPGFRFHPTDEELVSYYLRRKVKGLPLRVDAIADVDLYRKEPWELPPLSRLHTRDKEWYFFGALDRKYANRSRTNRATGKGYWKTTGKDRPVRHASRVVGMKKTLVFHQGRAPRGERTNWVMHEYRLEDESLSTDLDLGSFVVCRIFEKLGSGPQNGAQYGAPFVEEEWEAAEDMGPANTFMDISGEQEFVQPDDYEQKQILGDQHESIANVVAKSEGKDGGSHLEGPAFSLEGLLDLGTYIDEPIVQNGANIFHSTQENSYIQEQSHSPSDQNDEYLELKDIFDNKNMDYPCNGISFDGQHAVDNDHITGECLNGSAILPEVEGTHLLFNIPNGTVSVQEVTQTCLPTDYLQSENFLAVAPGDDASAQLPEDNSAFYDADSNELPYSEDGFLNTNDLLFSPTVDLSGLDMVDELMAYFDATENNLQYDISDSMENWECASTVTAPFIPELEGGSCATDKANLQVPGTNIERNASASARFVSTNQQSESVYEDCTVARDTKANGGWNNSLKKRVVNMLGSISAPPAFAEGSAKGKAIGLLSRSSSIRVSAGMVQIHGVTVMDAQPRALTKNKGTSFFLSYGVAPNNVVGKSVSFEPISKMQHRVSTMFLRGGMYLFGLSVLILSVSLKVGLCVCNK